MSRGTSFDPDSVSGGETLYDVDPESLIAGRPSLMKARLELQKRLQSGGVDRFTPIVVTRQGIIYDGNHAVRVAAEAGTAVTVNVVDAPAIGFGPILALPIA